MRVVNIFFYLLLFIFVIMLYLLSKTLQIRDETSGGGGIAGINNNIYLNKDGTRKSHSGGSMLDKLLKINDDWKHTKESVLHPSHLMDKHTPGVKHAVASMKRNYEPYEKIRCPVFPQSDYPRHYHLDDITSNWPPDDPESRPSYIYNSLCYFDYSDPAQREAAYNYRKAEVPFVVRNNPDLDNSVLRWADVNYMTDLFGQEKEPFRVEYSENNHFMYWRQPSSKKTRKEFVPPTEMVKMSFAEWYHKAAKGRVSKDDPHWYFRASACQSKGGCPAPNFQKIFEELPIFRPEESLFIIDPKKQRGVHCRFGMTGVIAENHFDGSRNMIALIGGERRYILSHPSNCINMALYPKEVRSGTG